MMSELDQALKNCDDSAPDHDSPLDDKTSALYSKKKCSRLSTIKPGNPTDLKKEQSSLFTMIAKIA